jgi:hypothetical protein
MGDRPHPAKVADDVVEAIEAGLERNEPRQNQRRLGQARLLGLLLRHNLVSHQLVINVLFLVIHKGHELVPGSESCDCSRATVRSVAQTCPATDLTRLSTSSRRPGTTTPRCLATRTRRLTASGFAWCAPCSSRRATRSWRPCGPAL